MKSNQDMVDIKNEKGLTPAQICHEMRVKFENGMNEDLKSL